LRKRRQGGGIDEAALTDWIDRYVAAWRSNEPDEIAGLFTDDALYHTAPSREPWAGPEGIVAEWLARKDAPGTWTFRYKVMAVVEDEGFVRGWTTYTDDDDYDNLWVIRLDGDLCSEFTEWFMVPDRG
jgi:hypothetical protein